MAVIELMSERESCEAAVVAAAYDYALAVLGFSHNGKGLIGPHCPDDAESRSTNARTRLLHEAARLAPALLADARCGGSL